MSYRILDIETRSKLHLPTVGAYKYSMHPSTEILCISYTTDACNLTINTIPFNGDLSPLLEILENNYIVGANVFFDMCILFNVAFKHLDINDYQHKFFDAYVYFRNHGLPTPMNNTARALGVDMMKMEEGSNLIKMLSTYSITEEDPRFSALMERMEKYCEQDVRLLGRLLLDSDFAQHHLQELIEDYNVATQLNLKGVHVDTSFAEKCYSLLTHHVIPLNDQLSEKTDGAATKLTQKARIANWMADKLTPTQRRLIPKTDKGSYSLSKHSMPFWKGIDNQDITDIINLLEENDTVSTGKFKRIKDMQVEDRIRGVFQVWGTSTGRYSSLDVQLQNLSSGEVPKDKLPVLRRSILGLESIKSSKVFRKLIRPCFISKPGHVFVINDWSQIEARVTATMAGQLNKLDMYSQGIDPYCELASRIFNREITKGDKERQIGKAAELACGYLGGVGALESMAKMFGIEIETSEAQHIVETWREANSEVVGLGNNLMRRFKQTVQSQTASQVETDIGDILFTYNEGSVRDNIACKLPCGTHLHYYDPQIVPSDPYEYVDCIKAGKTPKADETGWARHTIWRGLLLENVVQAICASFMRYIMKEYREYAVMTVHDEIILEVPQEKADTLCETLQEDMLYPFYKDTYYNLKLPSEPKISPFYGKEL